MKSVLEFKLIPHSHRLDGDVILAMPFIHTIRFGELIKDITMSEARWVTNSRINNITLETRAFHG